MIKAQHHWFLYPFFIWYGRMRMKLHFKKVYYIGEAAKPDASVLLVSNHFSWWDGFIIADLNQKIWGKKFHVMMLEEQLKKHWYFRHTGAFSIRKNSKSIIESLKYTVELLEDERNLVTLFPQGEFKSACQQPIHFENGLNWVLQNVKAPVQVIFVANQVEYFDSPQPQLFIHFKPYDAANKTKHEINDDYNSFFRECYQKNIESR